MGGFGPPAGSPFGAPTGNTGLPFAGVPPELAARAQAILDREPEHPEPVIDFSHQTRERGYTLSGGQRQRIAIARALLADPRILVLDDATSAIDVRVEALIHDALAHLMEGRTTIVIAHRLSTIHLADRVLLLDGGRIVAEGEHDHLLATEPRYVQVLASVVEDDEEEVHA